MFTTKRILTRGLLLATLATSAAQADTADSTPPPDGPATPTAVPSSAPVPNVVLPTPEADRAHEADKKAVADSKLTALVMPSPRDRSRPAFQLEPAVDVPILGVDVVYRFARIAKTQPAYCAPICDTGSLDRLDRVTAGYWSPAWSTSSDIGLWTMRVGSVAVLLADEGARNGLNDVVVVAEATLSASAVSLTMTLAAGRPRPYVFGDPANPDSVKAPLSKRNAPDAGLSFLSGHTTESFAFATSLYMAEKRLHPHSKAPLIILGTGLTVASFVGVGRIMSGNHFITDVIGGAIIGSSIGVLVPALHRSPVSIVPAVTDTQASLGIQGSF